MVGLVGPEVGLVTVGLAVGLPPLELAFPRLVEKNDAAKKSTAPVSMPRPTGPKTFPTGFQVNRHLGGSNSHRKITTAAPKTAQSTATVFWLKLGPPNRD